MSKRSEYKKAYKKAFHAALDYLHSTGYTYRSTGYTYRYIADVLTRIGENFFVYPVIVGHTKVYYWHKRGGMPDSEALIYTVIKWAEYIKRMDCFFKDMHAKIDEISEHTPESTLVYLRDRGWSYDKIAGEGGYLTYRTPRNWEIGKHKPRQVKNLYGVKLTIGVHEERMNKLMGKVAGELGLDKELHYALVPILNQYFDLFEPFLNRNDKWKWYECLEDYKRYKAQVLAEI